MAKTATKSQTKKVIKKEEEKKLEIVTVYSYLVVGIRSVKASDNPRSTKMMSEFIKDVIKTTKKLVTMNDISEFEKQYLDFRNKEGVSGVISVSLLHEGSEIQYDDKPIVMNASKGASDEKIKSK